MDATLLVPGVLLCVLLACGLWVLHDARSHWDRRRPVVATVVGLTIEQPEMWAILCMVACVLFIPMYLVARNADG